MIQVLLKHLITEICIELFFQKISSNFICSPVQYMSVYDFYVGQKFNSIEVIGEDISIPYPVVVHVNVIDEYVTIKDFFNTFKIEQNDLPRLRFIL